MRIVLMFVVALATVSQQTRVKPMMSEAEFQSLVNARVAQDKALEAEMNRTTKALEELVTAFTARPDVVALCKRIRAVESINYASGSTTLSLLDASGTATFGGSDASPLWREVCARVK